MGALKFVKGKDISEGDLFVIDGKPYIVKFDYDVWERERGVSIESYSIKLFPLQGGDAIDFHHYGNAAPNTPREEIQFFNQKQTTNT
jgi:hypothetical protein